MSKADLNPRGRELLSAVLYKDRKHPNKDDITPYKTIEAETGKKKEKMKSPAFIFRKNEITMQVKCRENLSHTNMS